MWHLLMNASSPLGGGAPKRVNVISVFFVAICTVLPYSIFGLRVAGGSKSNDQQTLRFGMLTYKPVNEVDPARIRTIEEYHYLRSIYSPLVEYSKDGNLVGSLAEKFYWDGTNLVFHLRANAKSSKGDPITAEDAMLSIKRLLILETNSHGNLKRLLCEDQNLDSLYQPCPGLVVENERLVLRFDRQRHYLIPMLANLDFAILPKKSFDHYSLAIIDHFNSSGPYVLIRDDPKLKVVSLKARPEHWLYRPDMPQEVDHVQLIDADGKPLNNTERLDALTSGVVDVLPTFSLFDGKRALKLAKADQNLQLFKTQNIALSAVMFTEKGLQRFSPRQRMAIGKELRSRVAAYFPEPDAVRKPTFEYFPKSGAGQLSDIDFKLIRDEIDSLSTSDCTLTDDSKATLGIPDFSIEFSKQMYGTEGKCYRIVSWNDLKLTTKTGTGSDLPELRTITTDVSFNENFSLLFYTASLGVFPYSEDANQKWLENYMLEENASNRLSMMERLHADLIRHAAIIPLASMPYLAMARKPWKLNFSDTMAGSPLWLISYESF
jgi:hypothetical protein